jgi:hypothetical protein
MRYAIALTLLLLAGCATSQADLDRQLAGQPTAYRDGFAAGCDSGYVAAGHPYYQFKKNTGRFESDRLYSGGWSDGFQTCKGQYEATQRAAQR